VVEEEEEEGGAGMDGSDGAIGAGGGGITGGADGTVPAGWAPQAWANAMYGIRAWPRCRRRRAHRAANPFACSHCWCACAYWCRSCWEGCGCGCTGRYCLSCRYRRRTSGGATSGVGGCGGQDPCGCIARFSLFHADMSVLGCGVRFLLRSLLHAAEHDAYEDGGRQSEYGAHGMAPIASAPLAWRACSCRCCDCPDADDDDDDDDDDGGNGCAGGQDDRWYLPHPIFIDIPTFFGLCGPDAWLGVCFAIWHGFFLFLFAPPSVRFVRVRTSGAPRPKAPDATI